MQNGVNYPLIQSDVMDPARGVAFEASLGREATIIKGAPLPPFFHQLYFWSAQPPNQLGRDGHPKVGGVIPDMGLPRRMWAGGRLNFERDLRAGVKAERQTICDSQSRKTGRTGPLGFVTLRHEIWQEGQLCLTEWQDLVYREDVDADGPRPVPPQARIDEHQTKDVRFNTTDLFRYSALTFNGHRIHYDLEYAKTVEGYDGLVVHGPLLAQHLMLIAADTMGSLNTFKFRATAPLLHTETATMCQNGQDFWVRGPDGRLCMEARVE